MLIVVVGYRGLPAGADNGERGYMLTFVIAYLRVSVLLYVEKLLHLWKIINLQPYLRKQTRQSMFVNHVPPLWAYFIEATKL